ncbi:hypothetical protein [Agrobacterium genomosp. 2]|uniref:Uncharacterized protein n=1 Tax=Agrobacterium genomosp. 2 str. CFBP 5494 TaxID=1183436 RepID=A0A9W5AYN7_9HYPH|nr:hypothetical protein [Agrobacterium genomosp. 2]CUW87572.1 hypothetical protein AGR2A_Cc120103 [Agrobacterium genomosp. 2 str. CFBP 5494]
MTAPRRRFGLPPVTLHVESLDRVDLVIAALDRCPDIERAVDFYGLDPFDIDPTVVQIGWIMAAKTGTDFRIGRRILQLLSPDGYLMPPLEFRLSRQTEPTEIEMYEAPFITPFRIELWQSGLSPAEWRINGSVYHPAWDPRIWSRLLYLNRPKAMALTDDGWIKLGRRI